MFAIKYQVTLTMARLFVTTACCAIALALSSTALPAAGSVASAASKEAGRAYPTRPIRTWSGLLAPAKTPRAIVDKLNREITRILVLPDIHQRLTAFGAEPAPMTPAAFDKLIAEQIALTTRLARSAGIKPE